MFRLWINIEKAGHNSKCSNFLKEQPKPIPVTDFVLPKWIKDGTHKKCVFWAIYPMISMSVIVLIISISEIQNLDQKITNFPLSAYFKYNYGIEF